MSAAPLITALLLAVLATPAAAAWRPPVSGSLTRPFAVTANPFEGGQHRGADLRAAPGTPVRAPCAGRVVVAGRVGTNGGVVTLICGRWRVTLLPLATITVHAGTAVSRGARLGTAARGPAHAGLHIGVRRDGTRFGYVDPLRFLTPTPTTPSPPLGRVPRGSRKPPPPAAAPITAPRPVAAPITTPRPVAAPITAPRPVAAPITAPRPVAAPITAPRPVAAPPVVAPLNPSPAPGPAGLAPWPAWVGLALVLAGAGVRWRGPLWTRTRRRVRATARLNE